MSYEKKEGDISIFKNKDKQPESKQPDYKGTALIDGKEKDVALWVRESASGLMYFSGQVKPKWNPDGAIKDGGNEAPEINSGAMGGAIAHDDMALSKEETDLPF